MVHFVMKGLFTSFVCLETRNCKGAE